MDRSQGTIQSTVRPLQGSAVREFLKFQRPQRRGTTFILVPMSPNTPLTYVSAVVGPGQTAQLLAMKSSASRSSARVSIAVGDMPNPPCAPRRPQGKRSSLQSAVELLGTPPRPERKPFERPSGASPRPRGTRPQNTGLQLPPLAYCRHVYHRESETWRGRRT